MRVERIERAPAPELAAMLGDFEGSFRYPLGRDRWFRISHGDDYHAFFRAMGQAACFVAAHDRRVVGSVAVVIRRLGLPDGGERSAAYVADLKVAPGAHRGRALLRLAREAESWGCDRTNAAFAVVMDGTGASPSQYTGRAGIPAFQEVGKLMVLRVESAGATGPGTDEVYDDDALAGEEQVRPRGARRHAAA